MPLARRELGVATVIAAFGAVAIALAYTDARAKETRMIEVTFDDLVGEHAASMQRQLGQAFLGEQANRVPRTALVLDLRLAEIPVYHGVYMTMKYRNHRNDGVSGDVPVSAFPDNHECAICCIDTLAESDVGAGRSSH